MTWGVYFEKPLPYALADRMQSELVTARIEERIPDVVLFLEHTPVITLGRRGRREHLLSTAETLAMHGVDLFHASRGGDVTYHAPGQLILYPILRLGSLDADAHGYLHNLEEIGVRTTQSFQVNAFRRPGKNGVWTDRGKLAAIGFRLKRWVTSHGMSYNVSVDLSGFESIVPCGLVGEPVTSLRAHLQEGTPSLSTLRDCMCNHFQDVTGRSIDLIPSDRAPMPLNEILSRCRVE